MISGIINIYKEKEYTSHDVVNIVRKTLGHIKTGHTGTLDPAAEGVLPICIGQATKIADYISDGIKTYKALLVLGTNTDTQDATGSITEVFNIKPSIKDIEGAIASFKGDYLQLPPMYSALKINGTPLYKLARKGQDIERKERHVFIHDIKILDIHEMSVEFEITCSKGTYIRTLCFDIGKLLDCGGHMANLIRIRSGCFFVENSLTLKEFKNYVEQGTEKSVIIPIEKALEGYKVFYAREAANKYLYNGNKVSLEYIDGFNMQNIRHDEKILIKDKMNQLIGIYSVKDNFLKPVTFLAKHCMGVM